MALTAIDPAPKFSFASLPVADPLAQAKLWRNVIYQALWDLWFGKPRERREACRWLTSDDFDTCCDQAGIEPGKMKELLKQIWQMPQDEVRAFLQQLRHHLDNMD